LERYLDAFPTAGVYRVLHLDGLPVNLQAARPWAALTWETVLGAYSSSHNEWVSTTARAWLAKRSLRAGGSMMSRTMEHHRDCQLDTTRRERR